MTGLQLVRDETDLKAAGPGSPGTQGRVTGALLKDSEAAVRCRSPGPQSLLIFKQLQSLFVVVVVLKEKFSFLGILKKY